MHRTLSLDYIVVLTGEIVAVLDGGEGEERTLKFGEIMIQRGTNHSWENRTTEWCRILCVMIGAEPLRDGEGKELVDTQFGAAKK
jgi:quercetin dioxygenase-like cupin family protein